MGRKASRIKNRDAEGFVVKGIGEVDLPFLKMEDVIEHCKMKGIPDDKEHLIYDPASAKQLAESMLCSVERYLSMVKYRFDELTDEVMLLAKRQDKFKAKCPKDRFDEVEIDRLDVEIHEELAKLRNTCRTMKRLEARQMELLQLTRLSCPRNKAGDRA